MPRCCHDRNAPELCPRCEAAQRMTERVMSDGIADDLIGAEVRATFEDDELVELVRSDVPRSEWPDEGLEWEALVVSAKVVTDEYMGERLRETHPDHRIVREVLESMVDET